MRPNERTAALGGPPSFESDAKPLGTLRFHLSKVRVGDRTLSLVDFLSFAKVKCPALQTLGTVF
jgi:hypothetical protein